MQSEQQFLETLLTTISNYLREKYGTKEMPEAIASHLKFYSEYKQAVEEKNTQTEQKLYIPQGKAEKGFYEKLINQLAEND